MVSIVSARQSGGRECSAPAVRGDCRKENRERPVNCNQLEYSSASKEVVAQQGPRYAKGPPAKCSLRPINCSRGEEVFSLPAGGGFGGSGGGGLIHCFVG